MKSSYIIPILLTMCIGITGCNNSSSVPTENVTNSYVELPSGIAEITDKDKQTNYTESEAINITFSNDGVECDNNSVGISGGIATITEKGTYVISGKTDNGQLLVNLAKDEDVHIILKGADITCKSSAPIYIQSADKAIITLYEGTDNILSDTTGFLYTNSAEEEPNATLFCKDSLTINGSGSLKITSNFNNGIQTKDNLKILGGYINIDCKNDAIKGKDSVTIAGGNIEIIAGGDGITSTNTDSEEVGYVNILAGNIVMDVSGKGIKAANLVYIQGGNCNIDSVDDCINCNNEFIIDAGALVLRTKDDAIRANNSILVNGGDINFKDCYQDYNSDNVIINNEDELK